MSIYGHFTQQYYGNKIVFPKESFLISGISFYKDNCVNITYDTELVMKYDPTNIHDPSAISIVHNDKIIGYVPIISKIYCKSITESLKIINIKKTYETYGIRVIPKCFYVYDISLQSKTLFSD